MNFNSTLGSGFSRTRGAKTSQTLMPHVMESPMALVTVRAAATRLGVGYSTLKLWIHQGKVRTTRTQGGHHRVADAEIERLLAKQAPGRASPRRRPAATGGLTALSARNRLRGYVEEIRVDGLLAQVRLRIGDEMLTAVITRTPSTTSACAAVTTRSRLSSPPKS